MTCANGTAVLQGNKLSVWNGQKEEAGRALYSRAAAAEQRCEFRLEDIDVSIISVE